MLELYISEDTRDQLAKAMTTQNRAFCLLPHEVSFSLLCTMRIVLSNSTLTWVFRYKLNKHIALYIENDVDFCGFQLICKQTYWAVNSDQSVWRERFLDLYDRLPTGSNFKAKYQARRKTLRAGANFTGGYTKKESKCLRVLRELILGTIYT